MDSLSEYADSIQDVYEKNIDDIINGLYDKSEDIPDTYGDAWKAATEETWEDKVDLEEGTPSGESKEEPGEGESSDGDGEGGTGSKGESETEGYYKKGLREIPDDWIEVEAPEELEIKSEPFIKFLREQGYNPKNWIKVVEKWASPDGTIYQRNYWTNGTDYYYHGEGIEEFFPHRN